MKIVLLETLRLGDDICTDSLSDFGEVVCYPETNTYEEFRQRTKDADVIIVDQFPINEESLKDATNLKLVTMTSTGTNFVDFSYTNSHNIPVANIKGYSTYSVAQHTISLLLYLYEKISYFDQYVRMGKYINDTSNSSFKIRFHDLYGKVWGIVGLGAIGKQVAKIAEAFGCTVIYHSPSGHPHSEQYEHVSFPELLKRSDVISVHSPLTKKTKEMFDYNAFSQMKPNAFFINSSRGGVVNEKDLLRILKENKIAGAGLDVLTEEPMSQTCPLKDALSYPNLVITPHMAWASIESRTRAIDEIYLNIKAYLNDENRNIVTG